GTTGLTTEFQRLQRGALAENARGDLVGGHAFYASGAAVAVIRVDGGKPGLLDDAVRVGALATFVAQAADHRHVFVQGLERLEDRAVFEVAAGLGRRPVLHYRAMREVDVGQARIGACGSGGLRYGGWNHGIKQRQGKGSTCTSQYRAAGKMFLANEHGGYPLVYQMPWSLTLTRVLQFRIPRIIARPAA